MTYFFHRDMMAAVRIERVGGFDLMGAKTDGEKLSTPRFKVLVEFDFGESQQQDGHAPADGDFEADNAKAVLRTLKESIDEAAFIAAFKRRYQKQP
jgi:hypothetical protein